jgi:hypothetical protein
MSAAIINSSGIKRSTCLLLITHAFATSIACSSPHKIIVRPNQQINSASTCVIRLLQDKKSDPGIDTTYEIFQWPLTLKSALEILKRTTRFTDYAVGGGGQPTPQIAAFNAVLDQHNAAALFEEVFRCGGPVGKLYAFCAYILIDKQRSAIIDKELLHDSSLVRTQFGCMTSSVTVKETAKQIVEGSLCKRFRDSRNWVNAYFYAQSIRSMQQEESKQEKASETP